VAVPPVDAPSATRITLRVQVMGTGKVVVDGRR